MNNSFDRLNENIRNIESSVVNFISAVAPWLAPISPAYMTYQHAVDSLNLPVWVAVPVAVVVEILGFSAVSTLLAFWFFNRRNRAESKKAPVGWVIVAFLFYLALIVTSNVLLDAFHNNETAIIAVKALYTLQTIPAALIVIARVGHKDLLGEIAKEKATKNAETPAESSGNFPVNIPQPEKVSEKVPQWRTFKKNLSDDELLLITNMVPTVIAKKYGMTVKGAKDWPDYAKRELVDRGVLKEQ